MKKPNNRFIQSEAKKYFKKSPKQRMKTVARILDFKFIRIIESFSEQI